MSAEVFRIGPMTAAEVVTVPTHHIVFMIGFFAACRSAGSELDASAHKSRT